MQEARISSTLGNLKMEEESFRSSTTAEIFPFFSKYGYYVAVTIIISLIVNTLFRSWRKGEQFTNKKDIRNKKSFSKEMCPDEEFHEYEDSHNSEDGPSLPKDLQHIEFKYTRKSEEEMLQRSLEFYKIANARRTLRFFSSDPVPGQIIRNVIKAAGTSPSGAHTEPWTFVVVSNDEVKREIREIVEREEKVNYAKRMGKKWTTDLQPLRTNWQKAYLTDAPYLILVFKQDYGILPNGKRKIHYYKEVGIAIACGILITAIQYTGLVTLTSTPLNCGPALRILMNRPVNEKLALLLPVGYPAKDATVPDLKRKELDDILIEIV